MSKYGKRTYTRLAKALYEIEKVQHSKDGRFALCPKLDQIHEDIARLIDEVLE